MILLCCHCCTAANSLWTTAKTQKASLPRYKLLSVRISRMPSPWRLAESGTNNAKTLFTICSIHHVQCGVAPPDVSVTSSWLWLQSAWIDTTSQLEQGETLYTDPEGNYCRPLFVCSSLYVGVNARLSPCTGEFFFTRLHDYHHFPHLSRVAFL